MGTLEKIGWSITAILIFVPIFLRCIEKIKSFFKEMSLGVTMVAHGYKYELCCPKCGENDKNNKFDGEFKKCVTCGATYNLTKTIEEIGRHEKYLEQQRKDGFL